MALSAARIAGPPTSPAWRIIETPENTVATSYQNTPCVSEMRPTRTGATFSPLPLHDRRGSRPVGLVTLDRRWRQRRRRGGRRRTLGAAVVAQRRRRGGNPRHRQQAPQPAADDGDRRAEPVRDRTRFELAELRTALEEHHVDADHPAAQPVGRFELADDVADDH